MYLCSIIEASGSVSERKCNVEGSMVLGKSLSTAVRSSSTFSSVISDTYKSPIHSFIMMVLLVGGEFFQ